MKWRLEWITVLGLLTSIFLIPSAAKADGITTLQAPINFDGTTNLAAFGTTNGTQVPSGSALSVSGIPGLNLLITTATGLPAVRLNQGTGWSGNFATGTPLLWTGGSDQQGLGGGTWQPNGPLTISFSTPERGIGFQIQANLYGSFAASLCAYDSSNTLLGCGDFSGTSTGSADNSALFVGLYDSQQNISSLVVNAGDGNFAINSPFVADAPVPTPEPGTFSLLGAGLISLLALCVFATRRGVALLVR